MSYGFGLVVIFPWDAERNPRLVALAEAVYLTLPPQDDQEDHALRTARLFLEDVRDGPPVYQATMGGLFTWGLVANHTVPEQFIDYLSPFWDEVCTGYHRVTVIAQGEDMDGAYGYDLWRSTAPTPVQITHIPTLPFAFWGWKE